MLPHVADDFGITIATAASFAAVFAFTFAAIQPLIGTAGDLFGKARLMIVCLVILGLANIAAHSRRPFRCCSPRASSLGSGPAAYFRSRWG